MSKSLAQVGAMISGALLVIATLPASAEQSGNPALPSFRDERRWSPRRTPEPPRAPDPAAAATAPADAKPAQPKPEPAAVAPPAAPATTPAAPVQKASVPPPPHPVTKQAPSGACAAPDVKTAPLAAGRMQVTLNSPCRAGQAVVWNYGGAQMAAKLDAAGKLDFVVDCFVGATSPVEMKLVDGTQVSLPVVAHDLDRVSKAAVIWTASVDLDLHALEFTAQHGEPGHVWSGAPVTLETVRERTEKGPRGAGFLSTPAKADGIGVGDRVEVYTFWHRDGHAAGQITFSVDHATRGATPAGETCGTGALAEVPFRFVVHSRRGQTQRVAGLVAGVPCNATLDAGTRFNAPLLPPLRIRP